MSGEFPYFSYTKRRKCSAVACDSAMENSTPSPGYSSLPVEVCMEEANDERWVQSTMSPSEESVLSRLPPSLVAQILSFADPDCIEQSVKLCSRQLYSCSADQRRIWKPLCGLEAFDPQFRCVAHSIESFDYRRLYWTFVRPIADRFCGQWYGGAIPIGNFLNVRKDVSEDGRLLTLVGEDVFQESRVLFNVTYDLIDHVIRWSPDELQLFANRYHGDRMWIIPPHSIYNTRRLERYSAHTNDFVRIAAELFTVHNHNVAWQVPSDQPGGFLQMSFHSEETYVQAIPDAAMRARWMLAPVSTEPSVSICPWHSMNSEERQQAEARARERIDIFVGDESPSHSVFVSSLERMHFAQWDVVERLFHMLASGLSVTEDDIVQLPDGASANLARNRDQLDHRGNGYPPPNALCFRRLPPQAPGIVPVPIRGWDIRQPPPNAREDPFAHLPGILVGDYGPHGPEFVHADFGAREVNGWRCLTVWKLTGDVNVPVGATSFDVWVPPATTLSMPPHDSDNVPATGVHTVRPVPITSINDVLGVADVAPPSLGDNDFFYAADGERRCLYEGSNFVEPDGFSARGGLVFDERDTEFPRGRYYVLAGRGQVGPFGFWTHEWMRGFLVFWPEQPHRMVWIWKDMRVIMNFFRWTVASCE